MRNLRLHLDLPTVQRFCQFIYKHIILQYIYIYKYIYIDQSRSACCIVFTVQVYAHPVTSYSRIVLPFYRAGYGASLGTTPVGTALGP